MDKLTRYANNLKKKKERAKKVINDLKNQGFVVPQNIRDFAESSTNDRITKKTYDKAMISLNLNRLKSSAKLKVDKVYHPSNPSYDINTSVQTDVSFSKLKSGVNKALKDSRENDRLGNILASIVLQDSGKAPAPGLETANFKIDNTFDPSKPYELSKHIQFKTMTQDIAKEIMQTPFASAEGYEAFAENAAHRGYMKNVKKLTSNNLTPEQIDSLETIMNSSQAWNIAKKNAYDSNQSVMNWSMLYNQVANAKNELDGSDFDKILTLLENEASMGQITRVVDEMLISYQKGE